MVLRLLTHVHFISLPMKLVEKLEEALQTSPAINYSLHSLVQTPARGRRVRRPLGGVHRPPGGL